MEIKTTSTEQQNFVTEAIGINVTRIDIKLWATLF